MENIEWQGVAQAPASLGGKGRNLRRLTECGLPVPRWFCVPSDCYQAFLQPFEPRLRRCLAQVEDPLGHDYEALARELHELLSQGAMDARLQARLETLLSGAETGLFAVRSSASAEDSAALSFAGIFDTYLYTPVSEILDKVRRCWLSVFSAPALSYLMSKGLSPLDLSMAVIVQEMVDARKSGVLFQANPSGRLDEQVVVAGYGLGEGVVSEQVEADTYYVNRYSGETRAQVSDKRHELVLDGAKRSGLVRRELAQEYWDAPVLGQAELDALVELSAAVGRRYAEYQDLEWAFDGHGRLYLLQSRPITTLPSGPLQLFDNSNISENYPGLTLPLSASVVRRVYRGMFYYAFRSCGYPRRVLAPCEPQFAHMVDGVEGRMYYNMSSWYRLMLLLPFAERLFIPSLENAIGAQSAAAMPPAPAVSRLRRGIVMTRFAAGYFASGLWLSRYCKRFGRLYRQARAGLEAGPDYDQAVRQYRELCAKLFPIVGFGRISDAYLMLLLSAIRAYFARLGVEGPRAAALINGLLVGERDLESIKPVQSVNALVAQAQQSEQLQQLLRQPGDWDELQRALQERHPRFWTLLCRHLEAYGDRTIGELKLETVTFRQDPLKLVALIAQHLGNEDNLARLRDNEKEVRAASAGELRTLLNTPLRRLMGGYLVSRLRRFVKNREIIRFNRSRYFGLFRGLFLCMGEALARDGLIERAEDVFYLTESELLDLDWRARAADFPRKIAERKARYAEHRKRRPLARLWLKGEVAENRVPQVEQCDGAANGVGLKGIGCCPGTVTAPAVVLSEPDQSVDVRGKIIVAENTDPGWVFLMMRAQGLVVEKGSLLSHTAIVGREMGIPTIVGLQRATSLIADGQKIRINGESGEIEIHA